jgi:hypothetical protein
MDILAREISHIHLIHQISREPILQDREVKMDREVRMDRELMSPIHLQDLH